jgi:hypothetical protein
MTSTMTAPAALTAKSELARWLGACPSCKHGIASEVAPTATCQHCGTAVRLARVEGVYSENDCDPSCMGAIGAECVCSCGGWNHGIGYVGPIATQPVWVAAHEAKRIATTEKRRETLSAKKEALKDAARAALIETHPALARLADCTEDSEFCSHMKEIFTDSPERMSYRQAAAAARMIERNEAKVQRVAQQVVEQAQAAPVKVGRYEFSGVVVGLKWVENTYAYNAPATCKITVKLADGSRIYVTAPESIRYAEGIEGAEELRGRTVTMTATVKASERDETFGFGSRPVKASVA